MRSTSAVQRRRAWTRPTSWWTRIWLIVACPVAAAPVRVPPPVVTSPADGSTVTAATPRLGGSGAPGDTIASEAGFIRCVATVGADG